VVTQKRVVKIGEEKSFRTPQNFLENPKRLFQNFGDFGNFSQKKSPLPKKG
jgi:hypothetical protein